MRRDFSGVILHHLHGKSIVHDTRSVNYLSVNVCNGVNKKY